MKTTHGRGAARRFLAASIVALGASACSHLTIDVDVYRGPESALPRLDETDVGGAPAPVLPPEHTVNVIRELSSDDARNWQNVNRIELSPRRGQTYLVVRDDVGDWYVRGADE